MEYNADEITKTGEALIQDGNRKMCGRSVQRLWVAQSVLRSRTKLQSFTYVNTALALQGSHGGVKELSHVSL